MTGNTATINSQAVECPSRICLSPAAEKNIGTVKPLCTDGCSSDDDCEGETGAKGSGLCTTGFICMVPTTVGDFCCRKLCVCKDLIETQGVDYGKTPEVCRGRADHVQERPLRKGPRTSGLGLGSDL
jgi:hypothetical protein